jgi:hypothetical protein
MHKIIYILSYIIIKQSRCPFNYYHCQLNAKLYCINTNCRLCLCQNISASIKISKYYNKIYNFSVYHHSRYYSLETQIYCYSAILKFHDSQHSMISITITVFYSNKTGFQRKKHSYIFFYLKFTRLDFSLVN